MVSVAAVIPALATKRPTILYQSGPGRVDKLRALLWTLHTDQASTLGVERRTLRI